SFDNTTGTFSGDYHVALGVYEGNYSTEFNSDGTLLYFGRSTDAKLWVINLLNWDEREPVYDGNSALAGGGSLQRAVNNEIYYSFIDNEPFSFLARINNP